MTHNQLFWKKRLNSLFFKKKEKKRNHIIIASKEAVLGIIKQRNKQINK